MRAGCIFASVFIAFTSVVEAQDVPFVQQQNVVYGEAHGVGLLMDVFTPSGPKNGLGIVDVVSGAWHSDRGKIRDHTLAQTFHIFCRKGYTVFAVRPGSITKFSVSEMLDNLNLGIRWVKSHAQDYSIDPDRLGLMGASAGGHLACLAAVTADNKSKSEKTPPSPGTSVKATGVFFPPTDFLNYGGQVIDPRGSDRMGQLLQRLAFPQGLPAQITDEELTQKFTQISPARLVTPQAPSFLLIHGDADPVVPLQQSEVMLAALKKAGVSAELVVKKGGGHPWLTLPVEVLTMAEWFDKQLAQKPALNVFLFAGQSNMAGADAEVSVPPGFQQTEADRETRFTTVPLLDGEKSNFFVPWGEIRGHQSKGKLVHGPEVGFARALYAAGWRDVAIIKVYANFKRDVESWPWAEGETLFNAWTKFADARLAELQAQGHSIRVCGFVWHQGIDDAIHGKLAAQYERNLSELIGVLRKRYAVDRAPFVLARSVNSRIAQPRPDPENISPMAVVRRAQVKIGESVPQAAWIDVDDLPNVNTHHFSADSQLIIGRRFGEAFLKLQPKKEQEK